MSFVLKRFTRRGLTANESEGKDSQASSRQAGPCPLAYACTVYELQNQAGSR